MVLKSKDIDFSRWPYLSLLSHPRPQSAQYSIARKERKKTRYHAMRYDFFSSDGKENAIDRWPSTYVALRCEQGERRECVQWCLCNLSCSCTRVVIGQPARKADSIRTYTNRIWTKDRWIDSLCQCTVSGLSTTAPFSV